MRQKFLFMFLAILLIIIAFSTKSNAALTYDKTANFEVDGITYTIPDLYSTNTDYTDVVVFTINNVKQETEATNKKRVFYVYLYNSSKADLVYRNDSTGKELRFYQKGKNEQYGPIYLSSYYCYDVNGLNGTKGDTTSNNYVSINSSLDFTILYSTHDIYNAKNHELSYSGANYDDVFFQETLVAEIPLAKVAEEVPGMMVTALKILIPVGLLVFGMVLLVSLCRKRAISKKSLIN